MIKGSILSYIKYAIVGFATGYTLDAIKDDIERKFNFEFIPYSSLPGKYFFAIGYSVLFIIVFYINNKKKKISIYLSPINKIAN